MIKLRIENDTEVNPATFVADNSPASAAWLDSDGVGSMDFHVSLLTGYPIDLRQNVLLGPSVTAQNTVWVDFGWNGTETGSETEPYNTVTEGLTNVETGGLIRFKGHSTVTMTIWTGTINQDVSMNSANGTVRIGG